MSPPAPQVGGAVDDLCRACKSVRRHTVMALGESGRVARVVCDHCGSHHNYRGGGGEATSGPRPAAGARGLSTAATPRLLPAPGAGVGETGAAAGSNDDSRGEDRMSHADSGQGEISMGGGLEDLLRRIIREECGLSEVEMGPRWRGGSMVIRPGREGVQEKVIPLDTFFQKIVMVRNRLRTLEQQVNGSDLPTDVKLKLQGYITGCYGSLTSFNILFAEEEDRFKGAGG